MIRERERKEEETKRRGVGDEWGAGARDAMQQP